MRDLRRQCIEYPGEQIISLMIDYIRKGYWNIYGHHLTDIDEIHSEATMEEMKNMVNDLHTVNQGRNRIIFEMWYSLYDKVFNTAKSVNGKTSIVSNDCRVMIYD